MFLNPCSHPVYPARRGWRRAGGARAGRARAQAALAHQRGPGGGQQADRSAGGRPCVQCKLWGCCHVIVQLRRREIKAHVAESAL